jgi:hypothetical protein
LRRDISIAVAQGKWANIRGHSQVADADGATLFDMRGRDRGDRLVGAPETIRKLTTLLWFCDDGIKVDCRRDEINMFFDAGRNAVVVTCEVRSFGL